MNKPNLSIVVQHNEREYFEDTEEGENIKKC